MYLKLVIFGIILFSIKSFAMPAQIILMRHAEKPANGNELSAKGWQRAKALPSLFRDRAELQKFGPPQALYAMAPASDGGSVRAIQTLQYLSEDLQIDENTTFTKNQVDELIAQIKKDRSLDGRLVVICWEHKVLIQIAEGLGVESAPDWPDSVFDRLWLIDFSSQGKVLSFQDLPERLLPGDSIH